MRCKPIWCIMWYIENYVKLRLCMVAAVYIARTRDWVITIEFTSGSRPSGRGGLNFLPKSEISLINFFYKLTKCYFYLPKSLMTFFSHCSTFITFSPPRLKGGDNSLSQTAFLQNNIFFIITFLFGFTPVSSFKIIFSSAKGGRANSIAKTDGGPWPDKPS